MDEILIAINDLSQNIVNLQFFYVQLINFAAGLACGVCFVVASTRRWF